MLRYLLPISALALATTTSLSAQGASNYEKLASELDSEPQFQVVWDFQGTPNLIAKKLTEYLQYYAANNPTRGIPPIDITPVIDAMGFLSVDGVALSSKKVDGRYHNITFYSMPEGPKGFMALGGNENRDLAVGDFAPADAMMAFESYLNADALVTMVQEASMALMGPAGPGMIQQQLATPIDQDGTTISQLIEKANTPILAYMDMDTSGQIPKFDFVVDFQKSGKLLESLRPMLASQGVEFSEEDGELVGRITVGSGQEMPGMQPMELLFIARGDSLYMASSEDYLNRTEEGPRLSTNSTFSSAIKQLPSKGASVSYVSPEYFKNYVSYVDDMMQQALSAEGQSANSDAQSVVALFKMVLSDYLGRFQSPQVTVSYFTDGGMKSEGYSDMSMGEAIAMVPVAFVGAAAGGAVAAMKAKEAMDGSDYSSDWDDEDEGDMPEDMSHDEMMDGE